MSSRAWKRPRRFDRNLVVIGAGTAGLVPPLSPPRRAPRSPWLLGALRRYHAWMRGGVGAPP